MCFKPFKLNVSYVLVICFNVCLQLMRSTKIMELSATGLSPLFSLHSSMDACIFMIFKMIFLLNYLSNL